MGVRILLPPPPLLKISILLGEEKKMRKKKKIQSYLGIIFFFSMGNKQKERMKTGLAAG